MPLPVKVIQVDGGSGFEAIFEQECQRRGIKLFAVPPRPPKLNGTVERTHRIHTEQFYEVTDSSFDLFELRESLFQWEQVTVIPKILISANLFRVDSCYCDRVCNNF